MISVTSTFCGALIGPTGVWLVSGHYSGSAAAVWMARNSASMLLIGIAGLRLDTINQQASGSLRQRSAALPTVCAARR
jgi:hypothetical protein